MNSVAGATAAIQRTDFAARRPRIIGSIVETKMPRDGYPWDCDPLDPDVSGAFQKSPDSQQNKALQDGKEKVDTPDGSGVFDLAPAENQQTQSPDAIGREDALFDAESYTTAKHRGGGQRKLTRGLPTSENLRKLAATWPSIQHHHWPQRGGTLLLSANDNPVVDDDGRVSRDIVESFRLARFLKNEGRGMIGAFDGFDLKNRPLRSCWRPGRCSTKRASHSCARRWIAA